MKKIVVLIFSICSLHTQSALAQYTTTPANLVAISTGQEITFTCVNCTAADYNGEGIPINPTGWKTDKGIVTSYTINRQTGTTTAYIQFTSPGIAFVEYVDQLGSWGRMPVKVNACAIGIPSYSIVHNCQQNTATISVAPGPVGSVVRWYMPGTLQHFHEGLTYSTPASNTALTYYIHYFKQGDQCSGERIPVRIEAKNQKPVIINKGFLTETGGYDLNVRPVPGFPDVVYKWYEQESAGSLLHQGNAYTTPPVSSLKTYYVAAFNPSTGCEGPRGSISVNNSGVASNRIQTDIVRINAVKSPGQVASLTPAQKNTDITYSDGFLRPVQQVAVAATPNGFDLIQPVIYDGFGRTPVQFLPYASSQSTTGVFDAAFKTNISQFYNAAGDKIANDVPTASSRHELTPLGRVKEIGNVGADWQLGNTTPRTQRISYLLNNANEVRRFNVDGTSTSFYPGNTLSKITLIDENGFSAITFRDSQGKIILQQQPLGYAIDGTTVNYLDTYYIYDELNRIKFIVSPKGTALLKTTSWAFTTNLREQFVTELTYDNRGRVVEKKIPGQAPAYYGYDKLNRLVLYQDGLLRQENKWIFVKYDRNHQPVIQGFYLNATQSTRSDIQGLLDDLYSAGNTSFPENAWYEDRGTLMHGYTNNSFPKSNANGSALEVMGVNYYGSHDFDNNGSRDFKYDSLTFSGQSPTSNFKAHHLFTGSKRLVMGSSNWLFTYIFYDRYNRVIQTRQNNHMNTAVDNVTTAVYDDEGKLLSVKKLHKTGATNTITIFNRYVYDAKSRPAEIYQSINTQTPEQLVLKFEYNELGQLVDKKIHQKPDMQFLQSVDYRYNIRGWLESINNSQLNVNAENNDDIDDLFGMEFLYSKRETGLNNVALYNGNISAIKWKGPGTAPGAVDQMSYKFTYDRAGQLRNAVSQRSASATSWTREAGALNEAISYDHNGNITTLQRNGPKHQISNGMGQYIAETIDNLVYQYNPTQGDQLLKVNDSASPVAGFQDATNTDDDFTYDVNGNVLRDKNKKISSVNYNLLGKPREIVFENGDKVSYTYLSSGEKLRTVLTLGTQNLTTDYVDGFVYETNALSFFSSPGGRVVKKGTTFEYQYAITDHQGNTRVLFSAATPMTDEKICNYETATNNDYLNYPAGARRSSLEIFDHTDNGGPATYSELLNGGVNGQVGLAKSFKVFPGDKLKVQAFAKYANASSNSSNLSGFASALTSAFNVTAASTGEALKAYTALNSFGGLVVGGTGHGSNAGSPKGFVTILIFDKNHNFLDAAWDQIGATYSQPLNTTVKNAFDELVKEVTIKEEGYAYIYLSNESATLVDIYFDDVTMTHTKTNVIQYNEYYPYGLQTSRSWTREDTQANNFLYNSATELNPATGWYDLHFRNYDPVLGRFMQVDPLALKFSSWSSYHFSYNSPINYSDPSGAEMVINYRSRQSSDGEYGYFGAEPGLYEGMGGSGGGGGISGGYDSNNDGIADWFATRMNWLNGNGWSTSIMGNNSYSGGNAGSYGSNPYDGNYGYQGPSGELGGQNYSSFTASMMHSATVRAMGTAGKSDYIKNHGYMAYGLMVYTPYNGQLYIRIDGYYSKANAQQGDPQGWWSRNFKDISSSDYPGVKIYETGLIADGTAVTLPGIGILIHKSISGTSKTKVLQHEYGHFLDHKFSPDLNVPFNPSAPNIPILTFYIGIGIPSLFNASTGVGGDHSSYWTEIRANIWAEWFFGDKYIRDPVNFPTKKP